MQIFFLVPITVSTYRKAYFYNNNVSLITYLRVFLRNWQSFVLKVFHNLHAINLV